MSLRKSPLRFYAFSASMVFMVSCAGHAKKVDQPPSQEELKEKQSVSDVKSPPAPAAELAPANKPMSDQIHDNMEIKLKKNGKATSVEEKMAKSEAAEKSADKSVDKSAASPAQDPAASAPSKRHVGPVEWSKALGWLKNGNVRFTKHNLRKDGQSKADIKRVAAGQKPHSIILSCSDSRVPPELVFDQKLGEVFTIRVAGEVLDSSSVGSIEYAIEHLGTNLILVMGHTACGAVKAAYSTLGGGSSGSPDLDKLVGDIQPRIRTYAGKTPTQGYIKESWANVKGVAKELVERSTIIRHAVQAGEVKVAEAMYDTDTGVVTFW